MEVTNKSFFPTSFGCDCFQGNLCFQAVSCVKYKRCNMMMIIVIIIIIIIIMIIIILMIIIITIMVIAIIVIIIMTM